MATVSINDVTYEGNSTMSLRGTVHDLDSYETVKVYISVRNENSSYKDYKSTYITVSNPVNVAGIDRNFTVSGIQSGYFSNDTVWHVSCKCDYSVSSEIPIFMPFEGSIPSDFIIPERPTQQTQNVTYHSVYKGQAGTCVANALCSIKHIQELRGGKDTLDYSVSWFYGLAGNGSSEELMYESSLNLLKSRGVPPYQVVKNTIGINGYPDIAFQRDAKSIYNSNNTSEVNKFALPQKIASWEAVGKSQSDVGFYNKIISAIKTKTVMMVVQIDKSLDDAVNYGVVGGIVGSRRGGHAMVVIGVKTINGKKHWIVQNSWTYIQGSPMGDNGLYYIPFSWFTFDWSGINGFYIINDDPNAPPLPVIPDIVDPPIISRRSPTSLEIYAKYDTSATSYQFRYKKTSETSYQYNDVYSIKNGRVYCTLDGLVSGTTYELSVKMKKNGLWSKWSNISMGTTSPWPCRIKTHVCHTPSSVVCNSILADGYDGGGYTGIGYRLYDVNLVSIGEARGEIGKDVIVSGVTSGKQYHMDSFTYYTVNGSEIRRGGDSFWFTFDYVGKPSMFNWTYPKVKGKSFNLKASEWNDLSAYVLKLGKYHLMNHWNPAAEVKSGEICKGGSRGNMWDVILNARRLLDYRHGNGEVIETPKTGNKITAEWLNNIVAYLNGI